MFKCAAKSGKRNAQPFRGINKEALQLDGKPVRKYLSYVVLLLSLAHFLLPQCHMESTYYINGVVGTAIGTSTGGGGGGGGGGTT